MSDQVKNIMLNMYPKRKAPLPSNPDDEEGAVMVQEQPFVHSKKKITDKWMFSAIIAAVCVFLFSSFFLDFVDDICMKRDTSAFNSKGEPKLHLIVVIFTIILLLTRTFFSLV
jgi:hypothetical protein